MFTRFIITCGFLFATSTGFAQSPARSLEAGRIEFDVSGWDWHVEGMLPGRSMQEGFHTFLPGHVGSPFLWTPAKVLVVTQIFARNQPANAGGSIKPGVKAQPEPQESVKWNY